MIDRLRNSIFIRLFSSSILMQALLSGANLCVGLLLIRRTTDSEYGYYVLVANTMLLLTGLQNAYIQPSLVYCVTNTNNDRATRSQFVGGLFREQRTLLLMLACVLSATAPMLWAFNVLSQQLLLIVIAGAVAGVFMLYREFFRMALLAYRRPGDVLKGDALYVAVLVIGTLIATRLPTPAALTALALGLAALIGGSRQCKSLQQHEMWDTSGNPGALRQIFNVGMWAALGAATHWVFAQGYSYLVAGTLSVASVAAIAATRTLIMPVNLISTGISTIMYPTVAGWLQKQTPKTVLRRMLLMAFALVLLASTYLLLVWVCRDWIFDSLLKKHFEQQHQLLVMWFAIGIVMLLRDQFCYVLACRARFRAMSTLTFCCAVLSLIISYLAMRKFGELGALWGLLIGELINMSGFLIMSFREVNLPVNNQPLPA